VEPAGRVSTPSPACAGLVLPHGVTRALGKVVESPECVCVCGGGGGGNKQQIQGRGGSVKRLWQSANDGGERRGSPKNAMPNWQALCVWLHASLSCSVLPGTGWPGPPDGSHALVHCCGWLVAGLTHYCLSGPICPPTHPPSWLAGWLLTTHACPPACPSAHRPTYLQRASAGSTPASATALVLAFCAAGPPAMVSDSSRNSWPSSTCSAPCSIHTQHTQLLSNPCQALCWYMLLDTQ